MNKVFKVIWNHATQSWVAVSELTQAKGKTKSKSVAATAVAAVVLGAVSSAQAAQISPGASAPAGYDFFYVDRQGTPAVQSAPILGKTVVGNPNATYLNKPSDIDKNIWDQAFGNNATADGTVYGVPAGTTDIGRPTGGALAWGSNVLTKGAQSTTIGYNSTTLSPNSQNLGVRNTIGKDSHHVVAIGSENQVTHGHHNVLIGSHNIIEKGRGDKKLTEANAEAGSLNTLIGNRNILKSGKKDLESTNPAESTPEADRQNMSAEDFHVQGVDNVVERAARSGFIGGSRNAVAANVTALQLVGFDNVIGSHGDKSFNLTTAQGDLKYVNVMGVDNRVDRRTHRATVIGFNSRAANERNITDNSYIENQIVIGNESNARGGNDIVMGYNANSRGGGQNGIAIGTNSKSGGLATTAVGNNAEAWWSGGVAMGDGAKAHGLASVAIGQNAFTEKPSADEEWDGKSGNDVAHTSNKGGSLATAVGPNTRATAAYAGAFASHAKAEGTQSLAMGYHSLAKGGHSLAVGDRATALGGVSTAIAAEAHVANAGAAIAIGVKSKIEDGANTAIALGQTTFIGKDAQRAIAIGREAAVLATRSGAIGEGSKITNVDAKYSYAIGSENKIGQTNTFVLGNRVETTQANSVILGADSTDRAATSETQAEVGGVTYGGFKGVGSQANGVVSVGAKDKERQIINVAAGNISATSTDAINGSQLYFVMDKIVPAKNTVPATDATKLGSLNTPDSTEGPRFVNSNVLVDAINKSFWRANIKANGGEATASAQDAQIKPGDKVEFVAGKGIKIEMDKDARAFTISAKFDPTDIPAVETTGLTVNGTDGSGGNIEAVTPEEGKKLVNATTVAGAINNSGWNLAGKKADGSDVATTVKPSNKVTFNPSDTADVVIDTTAIDNPTVTVNVKTAEVEADPANGNKGKVKVKVPQGGQGDAENKKLATAKTVADAINAAGFVATIGRDDEEFEDQKDKAEELINPGDKVTYQAGKNLKVKQQTVGGETKFTYATKDDVVFNDVNTKTLTLGGPKGTAQNATPENEPRADLKVVKGPADLTGQPEQKTRIQYTPVNPDGTAGTPENLATLKDGLKFKGNGDKEIAKPLNSTLSVEGELPSDKEASAKNVRVDVEGEGENAKLVVKVAEKPEFKGVTLNDGDNKFVHMAPTEGNKLTFTGGNQAGPVTLDNLKTTLPGTINKPDAGDNGNKVRTFTPIEEVKNDAATIDDVLNAGFNLKVNNTAVDFVKSYDTVEFVNGSGTTIEHVAGGTDSHNKIKVNVNTKDLVGDVTAVEDDKDPNKPKGSVTTPDEKGESGKGDKFATTNQVVDAINKSGWNLAGKDKDGKPVDNLVNPGDKVTFGSSDTADIAIDATDEKNPQVVVNVKTAEVVKDEDPANKGKVKLKVDAAATPEQKTAEGKKLVNAETVAQAINDSGFVATIGQDLTDFADQTGKAEEVINPGDKVVYQAGKNLKVKQETDAATNTTKFTYATEDHVDFNTVTISTKLPEDPKDPNNTKIIEGTPITMLSVPTKPNTLAFVGRDDQNKAAPVTIVNVDSGLRPYNPQGSQDMPAPTKGAEGLINLNTPNVEPSSAATVGDLQKMGWVVAAQHNNYEKAVKNADKVTFKGGPGIEVVGNTDKAGEYSISFKFKDTSHLIPEFVNITKIIGGKPVDIQEDPSGRITTPSGDSGAGFVSALDVALAINNSGFKANIGRDDKEFSDQEGKELKENNDRELVRPGDRMNYLVGKNLKVKREFTKLDTGDDSPGLHNFTFAVQDDVKLNSVNLTAGTNSVNMTASSTEPNTLNLAGKDGAPVTINNVGGNLPNTYNKGDKTVVDAVGTEAIGGKPTGNVKAEPTKVANLDNVDVEKVFNNAATVGDVLNSGWNLQANGKAADFVKPYDAVNFADGTGTTVEFVPSEDGKTNTIKVNTVMAYTDDKGNKVAKAEDGKYYPVGDNGKPDTTKPAVNNPQVNLVNVDGSTTNPTVLGNVAKGAKVFGPNIAKPVDDTPKAQEIAKNVSKAYEGLADFANSVDTNVMTVADAKTMGWVVSTLHGNGYAADVRNANHVDFVGTGLATVKGHTDQTTGVRVITVDVNSQNVVQDAQLPVVYTTQDGEKVVKVGDKFYKDADVLVFDGKVYPKGSVVAANGKVYPEGTDLGTDSLPTDSSAVEVAPLADGDKVVNPSDLIASMNNGKNDTKAPMPLANVLGTLKQVSLDGQVNNPNGDKVLDKAPENLTKAPNTAAEIDALHNDPNVLKRAATVGDVLNTGFNLQANGKDADFVRHGDVVNFADGTGTTIEFVPSADGKTNTIKVNTVMAYTDENGQKVAKAEDGKYYPVGDDGKPDTTKPEVKNPQVNLVNVDGSTTSPTVLGNVAKGAKVFGPNLFQPTQDTPEAKAMAQNISNAFEGLADLRNSNPTNVMTVADARNMGWVISTLHGNGYAADVRNANHVDFVGTGLATVKGHTDERTGIRVVTVDVNSQNVVQDAQLPVVYTTQDGERVVKVGDKFYKDGDVLVFDGKVYPKGSVVAADGKVYPEGTMLGTDNLPTDSNVQAISPMTGGTVEPQNLIASMNNGNNDTKAPMQLGNVGGNLAATYNVGDKVIGADGKPTDQAAAAPTKEQAAPSAEEAAKMYNNAATVGDVLNAGWNLQANGEAADFVKPYDTVNFKGEGLAKVSIETSDDGKTSNVIIKVDGASVVDNVKGDIKVNDGSVANKPKGSVSTPDEAGDKLATTKQVVDAINGSGWVATVAATEGGVAEGASDELVNPGEKVTFEAGKNIKLKQEGGKFTIATKDQLELGRADQAGKPGEDGAIKVNAKDGSSATLKVEQGPKGLDGNDGEAGKTKTRIVYVKPNGEKEQVATLNDGLSFTGDDETVKVDRKLGQTLNIKGGAKKDRLTDNNIGVVADPATGVLNVKLSKDVNLGDDGSLNVGGVTIDQKGINAGGKQIKNVAAGTEPTDAVNVSQLRDSTINIHNKINRNNKDLRAGIAGANAAAGLPQVYIPGKSMVAAAAGTFKGQSAVAVGYSRASDNGKLILKLQGNANTRGDVGGSVGVGYQW